MLVVIDYNVGNVKILVLPSSGIDFDSSFTVCVGKNNSGKSNLVKFLRELKQNHVPLNRTYVLQRANWYNNEIGVDCPLKLKILLTLLPEKYCWMCSNWILLPLISSFIKPTEDELNFVGDLSQPDLSLSPEKLDRLYVTFEPILQQFLPISEVICRMEFIRFSDLEQETNYSLEFNDLIAISTNNGRNFIQNIRNFRSGTKRKMREHSLWESHIASEITKSFNDEMPTRLEDFLQALTLEKISDFLTRLYDDSNKYLFPANIINTFYEQFLDF